MRTFAVLVIPVAAFAAAPVWAESGCGWKSQSVERPATSEQARLPQTTKPTDKPAG